jgi:HD superfamily phosphodiesterase
MNLEKIKEIAVTQMKDKRSHSWKECGNKYYHGERTANLVLTLRKLIFPNDSSHDDILTAAAWFHDITNGGDNHGTAGAELTRTLLGECCSKAELDEICGIIAVHDDRHCDRNSISEWVKLHQDADHLDHFGTFDIWMNFLYAVPHEQTINDVSNYLVNERPAENQKYRDELNFEVSRAIYNDKTDFLDNFTARFAVESSGGVWNLDNIVKETEIKGAV